MDYLLSEEQIMIRDLAREIAREKIKPVAAELDEQEEFPWEIMKLLAQSDLFGVYIDEQYGGTGGGVLELSITAEEFGFVKSLTIEDEKEHAPKEIEFSFWRIPTVTARPTNRPFSIRGEILIRPSAFV